MAFSGSGQNEHEINKCARQAYLNSIQGQNDALKRYVVLVREVTYRDEKDVLFLDISTGDIDSEKTFTVPKGYAYSGTYTKPEFFPTGQMSLFLFFSNKKLKVGDVIKRGRDTYRIANCTTCTVIKSIDHFGKEKTHWRYTLKCELLKKVDKEIYSSEHDDFKREMKLMGFDMKGWCLYKRMKTNFVEFMKAVLPDNVINVIEV